MRRPGTTGGRSGRVASSPAPVPRTPVTLRSRLRGFVVATALILPLSVAASAAAAPDPDLAAADSGSAYLVTQLVDGTHLNFAAFPGADYGLTADLAIALAATGGHDESLSRVIGYLAAHVADYADPDGTGAFPGPYSGALGKLALIAEITGQNPHSFGGFDLLTALTSHVCTSADAASIAAGTCTAVGDFYQAFSGISQALGVLALARGGVTVPASAVTRLEQLQCSGGGFSSAMPPGSPCTSDVDTTGYATQALDLLPGTATAVQSAKSYLLGAQGAGGGYTGAAGVNANSTGLAVQALLTLGGPGSNMAITTGLAFLRTQQNSDGGFDPNAMTNKSDARATTQAVPALARTSLTTLSHPVTAVPPTPSPTKSPTPSPTPTSTKPTTPGSTATTSAAAAPATNSPTATTTAALETASPLAATPEAELAATGLDRNRVGWEVALAGALVFGGVGLLVLSRRHPAKAGASRRRQAGGRRH
jgi:hypothetical protein